MWQIKERRDYGMSNGGITPDEAVNMLRAESETGKEEFISVITF
jgi:hypothetical protein